MSTEAEIVGIGPYSEEVADLLEYDKDWYDNVKPGAMVFSMPFFRTVTRDSSVNMAECCGVDMGDFNTHQIKSVDQIDGISLIDMEGDGHLPETQSVLEEIEKLKKLLESGFIMLFRPDE